MKTVLETERLFLREMTMDDYGALYRVLADADIMRHYPYAFDEKRVRAAAFTLIGMINVADVAENTTNGFVGQSQISLEQIINWNPQYIIRNFSGTGTSDNVKASDILANPDWAGIRAVQDGHVYQTPALPYNWIDRPPSVIKVLGAKWLGNLVYPEYFDYDIVAEAKEFFRLFYGWELKDEQLNNILAASR